MRRTDMRNRVAVLAAVLAFALGAVGLAVVVARSGDDALPMLPLAAGGGERGAADAASLSAPAMSVAYRFDGDAPDLPASATAYRLERDDVDVAVRELADTFGVRGEIERGGGRWTVVGEEHELVVHDVPGLPWNLAPDSLCPDSAVSSDDAGAVASCVVTGEATAQAAPDAPPLRPADLPSAEDARPRFREVFTRLGVGGEPTVTDNVLTLDAVVRPIVDGRPTIGYEHVLTMGPKGEIVGGYGWVGRPHELGDYPLVGVDDALDRLRTGVGPGPRTLRADVQRVDPCPDTAVCLAPEPGESIPEVVLTGVRLGLQSVEGHLVPAFLFEVADGEGPAVPAVVDRLLDDMAPTPEPEVPEGSSGCGVSVSGVGVDPGGRPADEPVNEPLTVEVCGPNTAKVGEEVVFEVTATDPDAPIYEGQCDSTIAGFGDAPVATVGCAVGCTAPSPKEPGKLVREYRHTYKEPGAYKAHFSFHSGPCGPYESRGEGTHTVVVK